MNHNFTDWLAALGGRSRHSQRNATFFATIFSELAELGFELENPNAIEGGYRLEFKKGDCWVIADRYCSFPVAGESPGIQLYNENEAWEIMFEAYSPIKLVKAALYELAKDENA